MKTTNRKSQWSVKASVEQSCDPFKSEDKIDLDEGLEGPFNSDLSEEDFQKVRS